MQTKVHCKVKIVLMTKNYNSDGIVSEINFTILQAIPSQPLSQEHW